MPLGINETRTAWFFNGAYRLVLSMITSPLALALGQISSDFSKVSALVSS